MFPSIESIEEIKVSSVNNTAEYSQLGDITTISRPGHEPVSRHGVLQLQRHRPERQPELLQQERRAQPEREHELRLQRSAGRSVRSRTFFFGTFERLDISRTQSAAATVPSDAFRAGRLLVAGDADRRSVDRPGRSPATAFPSSRINPVAAKLLQTYIPAPNDGTSIHRYTIDGTEMSNQFDVRIDQNFSAGHTLFGRLSRKKVDTLVADDLPESRAAHRRASPTARS